MVKLAVCAALCGTLASGFRSDEPFGSDVRRRAHYPGPRWDPNPKLKKCTGIGPANPGDDWCDLNCNMAGTPFCPPTMCTCDGPAPAPAPGPVPPAPAPAPPAPAPTPPSDPTPAPAPTPPTPVPKPDFAETRVAYFAEWAIYGRKFNPWDMDLQRLSHVNYAFFDLTPSCQVVSGDSFATTEKKNAEMGQGWSGEALELPGGTMGAFRLMRCGDDVANCDVAKANGYHFPHIKLILSLGGWTWSKHFSTCTRDAGKRATFVSSAVDTLEEHALDGLDFDWEYPTGCVKPDDPEQALGCGLGGNTFFKTDWADYISLLKEIRAEYKSRGYTPCLDDPNDDKCKFITTAAGMSPVLNTEAPLKEWVDNQDFVNLMTYDYHGAWQNVSAHQTALYTVKALAGSGVPTDFNIDDTLKVFEDQNVPMNKLTIGLAAYGRGWGDTTSADYNKQGPCKTGEYGASCPLSPGTWEAGVYSYWDVSANYEGKAGWEKKWDDEAKAPYLVSDAEKGLITYDDPESIQVKVEYAKKKGLKGFMWWESSDDPNFVLHGAAIDAWNGKMHYNTTDHK